MGSCCNVLRKHCCCCSKRSKRKVVLLLIGLDNAGKTSTAKSLIGEGGADVVPTVGFSTSSRPHRRCQVTILDVGGGASIRGIWPRYYARAHGAIFVVDAADEARLREAAQELETALGHAQLAGKPLLLLATKQDCEGALDELDVAAALELEALVNRQRCPTLVEVCSTSQRKPDPALLNGYKWLVDSVLSDWEALEGRVVADCAEQEARDEKERAERALRVQALRAARGDLSGPDGDDADDPDDPEGTRDPFRPVGELTRDKSANSVEARLILVQESPSKNRIVTVDPDPDPVEPGPVARDPSKAKKNGNARTQNMTNMVRTTRVFQVKKPAHTRTQSQANATPVDRVDADQLGRSRPSSGTGSASAETGLADDRPMSAGPVDGWVSDPRGGTPDPLASKVAMTEYVKDQLGLAGKPRNRRPLRRNNKTAPAPPAPSQATPPAGADRPGRSPRPAPDARRRHDAPPTISVVTVAMGGGVGESPAVRRLPPLRTQPAGQGPSWGRPGQRPDSAGSVSAWDVDQPLDPVFMAFDTVDRPPDESGDDVVVPRRP